jgi:sulfur-oxidizing protein SoxA
MKRLLAFVLGLATAAACFSQVRSGTEFSSEELRRLQASDAENPGMLWVDRGARLWEQNCAACHKEASSMKGVAPSYPKLIGGRVISLEEKIRQKVPFAYESDDLLGITAFVALQSRGMPMQSGATERDVDKGKAEYYRRRGQMNLSCAQCHEANWGKHLGAETLSQGHGNGYPAYRLEWQKMGSLQRRLRACMFGVHAELPPFGSDTLLELELFLARRASGLAIETPAVRR